MRMDARRRSAPFFGIAIILFLLLFSGMAASVESNAGHSGKALSDGNTVYAENLQKQSNLVNSSSLALNRADASKQIQSSVVEPLLSKVNPDNGLLVLEYRDALPAGSKIEPAFATVNKANPVVVTENPSWLFMVDLAPGAHFAHPVKLVVVDAKTQAQQVIDTEWWPKINNRHVFNTVSARSDPSLITFYKAPSLVPARVPQLINPNLKNILIGSSSCVNWAVVVCGFNDPSDTFHIDTNGIYNVLRNLGVDDDHIFYLSPQTGDPGVDRPTNVANVQWAISQVASQAKSNDKVLFFYSAHGGVDSIACAPDVDPIGSISASQLAGWLNAITSKEMSIIIEACHSGSFIGKYKDGTYVASEDDLAGSGINNRVVFTSASTDTSSYGDVDGPDDPNAATDLGSESIYGFIMAYSEPSADTNHDGRISFGEAFQYAWNTDVTCIRGDNTPQLREAGLDKNNVYLQCLNSGKSIFVPPLTYVPISPKDVIKGPPNPEPNTVVATTNMQKSTTGTIKEMTTT